MSQKHSSNSCREKFSFKGGKSTHLQIKMEPRGILHKIHNLRLKVDLEGPPHVKPATI